MAIYFPKSKFVDSSEASLAAGFAVTAEGQPMMNVPGVGLRPADASVTTGIFAGFAVCNQSAAALPILYATKVEEFNWTTGALVFELGQVPITGQIAAYADGVALTSPTVVGKKATITGVTNPATIKFVYKFEPTVAQQVSMQGNVAPSGAAGALYDQTGLVKRGTIYTDQFDATVDWSKVATVQFDDNGLLTGAATIEVGADVLPGAYVVSLPTTSVPFLGIEFSAA